uniref:Uncharacterized protein n=1 Tax=Romanomermis culicivorax TaxID=13658 RepID=A0A915JMF2_ROMCU
MAYKRPPVVRTTQLPADQPIYPYRPPGRPSPMTSGSTDPASTETKQPLTGSTSAEKPKLKKPKLIGRKSHKRVHKATTTEATISNEAASASAEAS